MKINTKSFIFTFMLMLILSTDVARADFSPVKTDDSEFTSSHLIIRQSVPLVLSADEIRIVDKNQEKLSMEVFLDVRGQLIHVPGFDFTKDVQQCQGQESTKVTRQLATNYFAITNNSGTYQIQNEVPCKGAIQLIFKSDSLSGQAVGIWNIAYTAQIKLDRSVGLNFWKRKVEFVWPAEADYYNFGEVHISRGDHWDVVGHELGHAIYDLGKLGAFGGGPHKIDECYSEALALSEGWASYFSAWLKVDPKDADAKFEFIVPRRAPIRFENIPADVCEGSSNEWRVTGFFWDLFDLNNDEESLEQSFAQLWNPLYNSRVANAESAMRKLIASGISAERVESIWRLNFRK